MPIHLHIGTHKTGTTAIQRQLRRNRTALKQQGIWYPNEAELLPGRGERIPHRNIAIALNNNAGPKPYSGDELKAIARSIIRNSQQYNHTIISSEAFWRIGFAAVPDLYSPEELWKRKQSNVAKIRLLFGDADVQITAVLRERGAYIQSGYSEFIQATHYPKNIQSYLASYSHSWDYELQLQTWASFFPVNAHAYEDLCENNQLPLNFLRRLCNESLPSESLAPDAKPRANVSEPLATVAFKRFLNQLPLPHEKRNKLHHKYSKIFQKAAQKHILNPAVRSLLGINSWLSAEELEALRSSLAAGDQNIRAHLCPSLVSRPIGHQSHVGHDQVPIRAMTIEDQQQLINWMLSQKPLKPAWFSPAELEA